jgi:predicted nucleic acid-binding protein
MIFIDSNIWCYYFDQRLPEHESVREPIREIIKSEEIACNTIIVIEVAHYIVRHFKEKAARKKIDYFINLRNMRIADFNQQMLTDALENLVAHAYSDGLGGRDATIIATLNSQRIGRIVSHDGIFKRLAGKFAFEVIDPIAPKDAP